MISIRVIFSCLVILIPLIIYILRYHKVGLKIVLYIIIVYLLVYKIAEYYYHLVIEKNNQYPVEFSAVSYFILSLGVLLHIKGVREFGSFLAFFSGLFYILASIISPESFLHNTRYYLEMARLNHTLLYVSSLLCLTVYYNRGYNYPYILGLIIVIGHAFIVKNILNYSDTSYVIYEISLGTFLKDINLYYWYYLIIYYILVLITAYLFIKLFNILAKKYYY